MPTFLIHFQSGAPEREQMTLELPNLAEARRQATLFAAEVLRDCPEGFWQAGAWRISLSNAGGEILLILEFACRSPGSSAEQPPLLDG